MQLGGSEKAYAPKGRAKSSQNAAGILVMDAARLVWRLRACIMSPAEAFETPVPEKPASELFTKLPIQCRDLRPHRTLLGYFPSLNPSETLYPVLCAALPVAIPRPKQGRAQYVTPSARGAKAFLCICWSPVSIMPARELRKRSN